MPESSLPRRAHPIPVDGDGRGRGECAERLERGVLDGLDEVVAGQGEGELGGELEQQVGCELDAAVAGEPGDRAGTA